MCWPVARFQSVHTRIFKAAMKEISNLKYFCIVKTVEFWVFWEELTLWYCILIKFGSFSTILQRNLAAFTLLREQVWREPPAEEEKLKVPLCCFSRFWIPLLCLQGPDPQCHSIICLCAKTNIHFAAETYSFLTKNWIDWHILILKDSYCISSNVVLTPVLPDLFPSLSL